MSDGKWGPAVATNGADPGLPDDARVRVWGCYDDDVSEQSSDNTHWPNVIAYRLWIEPPEPKVERSIMTGWFHTNGLFYIDHGISATHRITLTLRDGVPDETAMVERL